MGSEKGKVDSLRKKNKKWENGGRDRERQFLQQERKEKKYGHNVRMEKRNTGMQKCVEESYRETESEKENF